MRVEDKRGPYGFKGVGDVCILGSQRAKRVAQTDWSHTSIIGP